MDGLTKEIMTYSAAEQLAKDADFAGSSIAPYLERAQRYYDGDATAFSAAERATMRVQELLLVDDEATVLREHPELRDEYAKSDRLQLQAASDPRNLDHYLAAGVEFALNGDKIDALRDRLDLDRAVSSQLMRERIITANGFSDVRINFVYHDMMDHLWGFDVLRGAGLDQEYADLMSEVGNPFSGFLFSKQAELVSGVGYNTRRYLADSAHYGPMAASGAAINEHLSEAAKSDGRVAETLQRINDSSDLATAAGFVVNGALGSLLLQRSRWGAVKRIETTDSGLEITNEPVALMDPRYLSFIMRGVETLRTKHDEYRDVQLDLNLTIESLLRDYLVAGKTAGRLVLGHECDTSNIPDSVRRQLTQDSGVSTSFYGG